MKQRNRHDGDTLRRHAEQRLAGLKEVKPAVPGADQTVLVHELQVHQLELEMQNEELRRTQQEADETRSRYQDLYDFAPVGYLSLDAAGAITEANLTTAALLGCERNRVVGRPLFMFLALESRGEYDSFLRRLASGGAGDQCEVLLGANAKRQGWLLLDGGAFIGRGARQPVRLALMDITERKHAEAEIQRLASFPLLNPNPVLELDANGHMIFSNPAAKQILEKAGFNNSSNPLIPQDMPVILQDLRNKKAGQFRREIEITGCFFEELIYIAPPFQSVRIYTMDISERKRAEREREQLLVELNAVLNSITEGVVISDLKGNILTMNPSALAMHEYESLEQVRPHLHQFRETFELSDADGRPLPFEQWPLARALRGERFADYEVLVRRKDTGKSRFFSYSGTPAQTTTGDVILAVTTLRDITERKLAEEALRKSEKKFSTVFHSAPALLAISTLEEGRCIDINETSLRTLGYQREEIVGRTALELGIWGSRAERDTVVRILEEHGTVRDLEISFSGKSGKTFTGLFSAELVDFNGNRYMLSMVNDITERKRMEEKIEQLNTDLAARAAELEAANRELEAFNYTVAHDLRKPLTVVNGYCQAIRELCGDSLDAQCAGYLREAYDGTLRMNRLIDALLNFSRMARVELRRETVDLSGMAREAAAELKAAEPERRVTFRIADGITVDGDANLLRVALDNLLGNAWKYTGSREEAVIEFGRAVIDGRLTCFVRDNGPGFAAADAAMLFVPFRRLPGAEEYGGFGIGLATVERIIRRHGGRVWAEGEPDKGATFYFTL